jgi:hypothetical protein
VQDGETVEEIEAAVKTRLKEIKKRRRRIRVGTTATLLSLSDIV